jgi:hypothetical protein
MDAAMETTRRRSTAATRHGKEHTMSTTNTTTSTTTNPNPNPNPNPNANPNATENAAATTRAGTRSRTDIAVAVYDIHPQAEAAVKALQRAGFDMRKISIIGRDYHTEEHVVGFLNAGDRAKIYGKYGAFWGGLVGVLFGSAMMFVPVVGHVVVMGPLAAALFGGLQGAVLAGGISALAGALMALGIPKDSVLRYETALKADKFMLVVHGDAKEIRRAYELLKTSGLASFDHHRTADERPASPHPESAPAFN